LNRRRFLGVAVGAILSRPTSSASAQTPGTPRRVGVLAPSTAAKEEITLEPFFTAMRRLGWIEGRNIVYDRAYAADGQDALPRLAAELVARNPDLIYAPPATAAVAARAATQTIPIVFGSVVDPVASGLVASLAHPGGNVTGVSSIADSLAPKRIELLREVMPRAKRIGLLGDSNDPVTKIDQIALAPIARSFGLSLVVAYAANPAEFDAAVASLIEAKVDVVMTTTSLVFNLRDRLIELTGAQRVPVIGHRAQMADDGALLSYGASLADQLRRSAALADKVLRGAKPRDIPVEQPTKFELVVNLLAARSLRITVPRQLLLRADRVIE
jgi:putative ABC transport system substrate-binding protein